MKDSDLPTSSTPAADFFVRVVQPETFGYSSRKTTIGNFAAGLTSLPKCATIYGGSGTTDAVTIQGTSNGSHSSSYVILQPGGGNVAIGATGASTKLLVKGTGGSTDDLFTVASPSGGEFFKIDKDGIVWVNDINGAPRDDAYLYLTRNATSKSAQVWYRSNTTGAGWQSGLERTLNSNDFAIRNYVNGKCVIVTADNANIGVNVVPLSGLDVPSAAFGTYAGVSAAPANSIIVSGSVGIGTASPAEKLDVNGSIKASGALSVGKTITASGNTGNQTINTASGTVNFASTDTSLVVTNGLCTTSSLVFVQIRTSGVSARVKHVVSAAGSFTITLDTTPGVETSVGFFLLP